MLKSLKLYITLRHNVSSIKIIYDNICIMIDHLSGNKNTIYFHKERLVLYMKVGSKSNDE